MKQLENNYAAIAIEQIDQVDEISDKFVRDLYKKWTEGEQTLDANRSKQSAKIETQKHAQHPMVGAADSDYQGKDYQYYSDNYVNDYQTLGFRGCWRAIKKPNLNFIGVFSKIHYSEYVLFWGLPVALMFNTLVGPWKVFRQSMLWISGLGTFQEILSVLYEKFIAFWLNIYLLLLIPTWLMIQLFGVPIELGWIALQLTWWLTIQTWNATFYQFTGLVQITGGLFAFALLIGYENQKFQDMFQKEVTTNGWGQFFAVLGILTLWPFFLLFMWFLWTFELYESNWCPPRDAQIFWWLPSVLCHDFNWPTGAINN